MTHQNLRELGETCGPNRAARPMKQAGLKAQVGYNKPHYKGGKISILDDNHLNQCFDVQQPNQAWGTDITTIRTYEGRLFLAVVIDLFSCQVIGWSIQPKMQARSRTQRVAHAGVAAQTVIKETPLSQLAQGSDVKFSVSID